MQGLGNDFVVIDATQQRIQFNPATIKKMADRRYGIGFDQLLMLEASQSPHIDFNYRIFNADGSEAEQCGNGARCIAKFIHEQGLSSKQIIVLKTITGTIELQLQSDGNVKVNMGFPNIINIDDEITVDHQHIYFSNISVGNPHAVIPVNDIHQHTAMAAQISTHPRFPAGTNVGFMHVLDSQTLELNVYERGTGWTLACGSGACAAAAMSIMKGLTKNCVEVKQAGGNLIISWAGAKHPLYMTGPGETVFHGEWETEPSH